MVVFTKTNRTTVWSICSKIQRSQTKLVVRISLVKAWLILKMW